MGKLHCIAFKEKTLLRFKKYVSIYETNIKEFISKKTLFKKLLKLFSLLIYKRHDEKIIPYSRPRYNVHNELTDHIEDKVKYVMSK